MTLKEEILKNSLEYKGNDFEENLFFTKLAKGFANDYKLFGEDTVEIYNELFGEEYSPIFESFEENIEVLTEASNENIPLLFEDSPLSKSMEDRLLKYTSGGMTKEPNKKKSELEHGLQHFKLGAKGAASKTSEAFEDLSKETGKMAKKVSKEAKKLVGEAGEKAKEVSSKAGELAKEAGEKAKEAGSKAGEMAKEISEKAKGVGSKVGEAAKEAGAKAGEVAEKGKGFLASMWGKIKEFGQGLADKFPKVADFLQKGVTWVIANPAIVAGAAGGALLLGKLISVLKKRGQAKKAAKLQAALDASKEKTEEKKAASLDTTGKAMKSLDTTGKEMKSLDTTGKSMKSMDTSCKKKHLKKD